MGVCGCFVGVCGCFWVFVGVRGVTICHYLAQTCVSDHLARRKKKFAASTKMTVRQQLELEQHNNDDKAANKVDNNHDEHEQSRLCKYGNSRPHGHVPRSEGFEEEGGRGDATAQQL